MNAENTQRSIERLGIQTYITATYYQWCNALNFFAPSPTQSLQGKSAGCHQSLLKHDVFLLQLQLLRVCHVLNCSMISHDPSYTLALCSGKIALFRISGQPSMLFTDWRRLPFATTPSYATLAQYHSSQQKFAARIYKREPPRV
jgi:hypothetical protein